MAVRSRFKMTRRRYGLRVECALLFVYSAVSTTSVRICAYVGPIEEEGFLHSQSGGYSEAWKDEQRQCKGDAHGASTQHDCASGQLTVRGGRVLAAFAILLCSLWTGGTAAPGQSPLAQSTPAAPSLLTQVRDVHDLPAALAVNATVHLTATVSYYDPDDGVMFVQDASGGVYINTDKAYPVKAGDLVEIAGHAAASYRTEVAMDPVMRVIGKGGKFVAPVYEYADLIAGRGDCRLVRIRGKVLAAGIEQHENARRGHLDIALPGGEVQVYLGSSKAFHPETLLDAMVEVTGVAGGAFDAKYQLTGLMMYSTDAQMVRVEQPPLLKVEQLPLTDINEIFQTRDFTNHSQRVRVRGVLTYYKPGDSAAIESNGKSIYAQTRQTSNLAIGDVVDVSGFASDREYAPSLSHAAIVSTGVKGRVVPRPISYQQALSGEYSDNLVSMVGNLATELHDAHTDTLVVEVDGHLVNGYLESKSSMPDFALGSRVQVVGVCRIQPGGPWRTPYLFSLQMRDAHDARVVSQPSWWTVRHLAEILSALAIMALSISAWAVILRRRVMQQTARIERSMKLADERSRILEKISSNHAPDVLLSEICASVMMLLPGVQCSYCLYTNKDEAISEDKDRKAVALFRLILKGANEQACGEVIVCADKNYRVLSDQKEVYATLSEMATLAMRQSLLHQSLVHHSTHDPLTELPNRRLSESKLGSALEEAARNGTRLAVIYIDVNCFKHINDRYGHRVGDVYLQLISARLQAQIRLDDMLARIGGDEFLVIVPLTAGHEYAEHLTLRLKACFEEPFYIDGHSIEGSASFGLARYPQDGRTAEELQRKADYAMYLFKRNAASASDQVQQLAIITPDELESALSRELFRLDYQPQFSSDGRLTGIEALIRLEDPILGRLTPDAFISVAERNDVILGMGAWVLRRALQDARRWQLDTGPAMVIVVNISAREMNEPGFSDRVLAAVTENAFPAERLELELTERSLVSDPDNAARQLRRLRQAGVRISLDDFGTGQSSLSLLHKLPIDTIKLDRSFIVAMDDEPEVIPIIEAIAFMATRLGKRIVAEGIEHVGPVPALLKMGKLEFQGYLLSRPIPAEEVDNTIETWRRGLPMPDAFNRTGSHIQD